MHNLEIEARKCTHSNSYFFTIQKQKLFNLCHFLIYPIFSIYSIYSIHCVYWQHTSLNDSIRQIKQRDGLGVWNRGFSCNFNYEVEFLQNRMCSVGLWGHVTLSTLLKSWLEETVSETNAQDENIAQNTKMPNM